MSVAPESGPRPLADGRPSTPSPQVALQVQAQRSGRPAQNIPGSSDVTDRLFIPQDYRQPQGEAGGR